MFETIVMEKPRAINGGRAFASLLIALTILVLTACIAPTKTSSSTAPVSLIPNPAIVERSPGFFSLREGTQLLVRSRNAEAIGVARYFADLTKRTLALNLDVRPMGGIESDAIVFLLDPQFLVNGDRLDQGYELSVAERVIRVTARTPQGLFYGAITLWQLLSDSGVKPPLLVPQVAIRDYPRFAWRGVMLDSARHFQSTQFVKKFIDEMALHKLNTLQWHLTDDQGWRIEIKKYPRLTQIGAWRTPPGKQETQANRYGGFYTQEEIADVVRYAAARYVTIVPEIEMPGHAQAAIAAYPQLGVAGSATRVSGDWGVHTYLYNVDESTFSFLEDVLSEVMALFPSQYIHIGGDEAAKDQWQASPRVQQRMHELGIKNESALQGYFTARIEKYLSAHGRKLVGWDEILEGGVPASATVMSWRGAQGAIDAAKAGHDVVMAPSPTMYFDHLQSSRSDEPTGRPDVVSLADVYAFDPIPPQLNAEQARHVLGAQANLWSEYLTSSQRIEHAAFPRIAALAEALWSPSDRRDWKDFSARMPTQLQRYRQLGVEYADANAPLSTQANPSLRDSDALKLCTSDLALRIAGDPDSANPTPIYRADILNPCWIYTQADLGAIASINVRAGHIPYYFQLWHDAAKIVSRVSVSGKDELQVHLDDCATPVFAAIPLKIEHSEIETIDVPIPQHNGVHDVCLNFAGANRDPLWLIDSVMLVPK
jgi:hexosaminidase